MLSDMETDSAYRDSIYGDSNSLVVVVSCSDGNLMFTFQFFGKVC